MNDWRTFVDLEALDAWMSRQALGEGPIQNPRVLGGGTQNSLVRFERGNRSFVLRRPPAHPRADSNDTMRREMRMLGAISDSRVPHPRLIAGCPSEDVLGVAFYLMEPVDGFNPTTDLPEPHASDPPPSMQHRMGLELVAAIAELASIDYRSVGLDGCGTRSSPATSSGSFWRAPTPAPAPGRRRRRSGTRSTATRSGCSNGRWAGSSDRSRLQSGTR